MSANLETARQFYEACETGKGWEACSEYCHADATFASQTQALGEITHLKEYCEWAKSILTPIPDGHYELKFLAEDGDNHSVAAVAVFHGTQTGPGGPVAVTGKVIATDYVYHMLFDRERIRHMTKIWNDTDSMQQLGWV